MPELPEVETIRRSLRPRIVGKRISAVEVRESRLRRPVPRNLSHRLVGRRIEDVERRAKYLLLRLTGGECVLVHFGMSGSLILHSIPAAPVRHDHVRIRLSDGSEMVLNDPRRFGLLKVVASANLASTPELRALGTDPLDDEFTPEYLRSRLRESRRAVKNLLLDQTALAGLGNIYSNEALFRARIRPTRRAHRVRTSEIPALREAIRVVLREAVELGGSSIADYRDGEGRPGYFQLRLRVYDRAGEPCTECATRIRRIEQAGRSSFYCPACQR
jgi:formamidopyrimidine-DNA glycosylase